MRNGQWSDGWSSGSWWMMAIMMTLFGGALISVAVFAFRRGDHQSGRMATNVSNPARPTAQEILAERLARGEIEPDDYRQRLDTLRELHK